MNEPYTLVVEEAPDADDVRIVLDGLRAYNRSCVGDDDHRTLAVFLRDEQGTLVAGLLGGTYWGWLHVDIVWVQDGLRRQGYGRAILAAAEQEALRRGCRYAHLDTMSFQALPFYEKAGYTLFGELQDLPAGHSRYFLKKALCDRIP